MACLHCIEAIACITFAAPWFEGIQSTLISIRSLRVTPHFWVCAMPLTIAGLTKALASGSNLSTSSVQACIQSMNFVLALHVLGVSSTYRCSQNFGHLGKIFTSQLQQAVCNECVRLSATTDFCQCCCYCCLSCCCCSGYWCHYCWCCCCSCCCN